MKHIFCIMGKSGTGKDTIARKLLENKELNLRPLVPYTTRPKRPNETEGVEYHFTTEEEFNRLREAGKVIEYRTYPHYVDGNVIYYTVDDIEPDTDYLLITTPEAYSTICDYINTKCTKFIGCKDIYIYVDTVERLRRCYEREIKTEGTKYRELIRRFLADEEDYADVYSFDIRNEFENKDLEETVKEVTKFIKLEQAELVVFPITTEKQNGFANGHDRFMITNISESNYRKLADFLYEELGDQYWQLTGLNIQYNPGRKVYSISFEGNDSRFRLKYKSSEKSMFGDIDLLRLISKQFPDMICYWADCWDDEVNFDCLKNGQNSRNFTLHIDNYDEQANDDEYYADIEVTLTDSLTGAQMSFGGGMVYKYHIEEFIRTSHLQLDIPSSMKYLHLLKNKIVV